MYKMETIKYINRKTGEEIIEQPPGQGFLNFMYGGNPLGKIALNLLMKRKLVSALGGWYMDTKKSAGRVQDFVAAQNINIDDFVVPSEGYATFNDFFYRQVKPQARPIGAHFVAPADGKLLVFDKIDQQKDFFIKGQNFNLETFLGDKALAKKYEGGSMAIVRLAPVDYHRFHFSVAGPVSETKDINGAYYSVSPLALRKSLEIFCANKRAYAIQKSEEYGDVLYCEVGATMVGSILQTYAPGQFAEKGAEKGYFAFGGSTTVVLLEPGRLAWDADLVKNTQNGVETAVYMGEQIGANL